MMPRIFRPSLIAGALFLACLAVPGVAAAAVGDRQYKITSDLPLHHASGGPLCPRPGRSDAGSWSTFAYPNATEDLKTALTNFAPGLLGNPESVPKCPEAALAGRRHHVSRGQPDRHLAALT